jgi:hypothetical protein
MVEELVSSDLLQPTMGENRQNVTDPVTLRIACEDILIRSASMVSPYTAI